MSFGFVKAGAYTPKIKVADVKHNLSEIKKGITEGKNKGVRLLVFPELCVTGYTCGDLFYSNVLLEAADGAMKEIAEFSKNTDMLIFIGMPFKVNGLIYNVAVGINNGKVLGIVPKTYLPNYNEFYEKRQFTFASDQMTTVKIKTKEGEYEAPFGRNIIFRDKNEANFTVAAELCEDLWTPVPPSISHAINGATVIVNLSCSDENIGKADYRRILVKTHSSKLACAYVYANEGEGESTTDMVFSGHNVIAENGEILKESVLFENGLITADIDTDYLSHERSKTFNQEFNIPFAKYTFVDFCSGEQRGELERFFDTKPFLPKDKDGKEALLILTMQSEGLKKRLQHTRADKVVLGVSGGLDSTLALIVAVMAVEKAGKSKKDVLAVTMPCFGTTSRTYLNTIKLAKAFGVTLKKVDITKSVKRHLKDIKHADGVYDVTFENAQARERTQVLMDIANMNNGLVVGTGDLSELALGWATYNGDHMSMYAVNSSVPKTLVRYLVDFYASRCTKKLLAVLKDVLDTPVSPELLPSEEKKESDQKTEDIVGPYELHDFFIYNNIRNGYSPSKIFYAAKKAFANIYDDKTVLKWLKIYFRRFFTQQFKRSCMPDGIKVGSVTLSPRGSWRMPSDAESKLWLVELEKIEKELQNT